MMRQIRLFICMAAVLMCGIALGGYDVKPGSGEKPQWAPAQGPKMTGEVKVGVVMIRFPDTQSHMESKAFLEKLNNIGGLSLEEYFKLYSHGTVWPKLTACPGDSESDVFLAPHTYGYYCDHHTGNPLGYRSKEEGNQRVEELKKAAFNWAKKKNGKLASCKVLCVAYITNKVNNPESVKELTSNKDYEKLIGYLVQRVNAGSSSEENKTLAAWRQYRPYVKWGEPLWPNSSIQINSPSSSTMAHELGHVFGAPDVYRVGRSNDGISGNATLMAYGPTASAFSLYYHHGFLKEKNCPMISASGTYMLYPRHMKPEGDNAVGYFIPTSHPHYYFYVEYINGEDSRLGTDIQGNEGASDYHGNINGGGVVISVFHPGVTSYLGSPDTFYTYRPNDPYFRGKGDVAGCLFGQAGKTEFTLETNPSAHLPNLLDGGVRIRNIREEDGKAVFDVELTGAKVSEQAYKQSLLPRIKLDKVEHVQPYSFVMKCTPKFRGEPVAERYGFCWGTAPKPTVKNSTAVLMHHEIYEARALGVKPKTRYYVRAFAQNKWGVRYSDEELTVTTPPLPKQSPKEVPALMMDSYSHNYFATWVVGGSKHYSSRMTEASALVLAKLWAYHKPAALQMNAPIVHDSDARHPRSRGNSAKSSKSSKMDFDTLHYDPLISDPEARTNPTRSLLELARSYATALKMYDDIPNEKAWTTKFAKTMKCKGTPVVTPVTNETLAKCKGLIVKDLAASLPVLVMGLPDKGSSERNQWGLITGYDEEGNMIFDFPQGNVDSLPGSSSGRPRAGKATSAPLEKLSGLGFRFFVITGINIR